MPNSPHALDFFYRILYNVQGGIKEARYIGEYPTQAVIDEWAAAVKRKAIAENAERLVEILEETARKNSISLSELDLSL